MSTVEAPASDEVRESLVARLSAVLGDGVVDVLIKPGVDLWVRVTPEAWVAAHQACRTELSMDFFGFLAGMDWMPSPYGKGEDDPTEPAPERDSSIVPGYTGGDSRFQVFSRLHSTRRHVGITLKADVPESMSVDTISGVYPGANWHERECWEMFGIGFAGHPNLTHIYLPSEFEGHPLRKDFPLLARIVKPWPGIVDVEPMPGDDADSEES
jgi:NADH-quinone oxidoreductase subunit C